MVASGADAVAVRDGASAEGPHSDEGHAAKGSSKAAGKLAHAKPRKAKAKAAPTKPTRTLESWFKPTTRPQRSVRNAANEKKEEEEEEEGGSASPLPHVTPLKQKTSAGSSKKLVQRRIHITDVCRVCDSARTEDMSRCELRCLGCEMTVHKKCYNVRDDPDDHEWRCRRCQFVQDQQRSDVDNGSKDDDEKDDKRAARVAAVDVANVVFPTHDALGESRKYAALHRAPEFATVFRFLQRFRHLGLRVPADLSLQGLAEALINPQETRLCEDLHTKLLITANASMSKNLSWSGNMLRFLDSARTSSDASRDNSSDDLRRDDASYWSMPIPERVAILKQLCELQFDRNDTLIERIDGEEAEALRDEYVGVDASGRAYSILEDVGTIPNAAVWVCRCANVDGSEWETVSDDLESLESLVEALSLSTETSDLQLWQSLSSGILKKLTRRRKKEERTKSRIARMPRILESSGMDTSSILPDGVGISGRSLRSRRPVSYRQLLDDEDEDNDEDDVNQSDDDDDGDASQGDDDAPESEGSGDDESLAGSDDDRPTSGRTRKRAPASPPARRSKRLRGSSPN